MYLYIYIYLDLPRGAEWMIRGAYTPSRWGSNSTLREDACILLYIHIFCAWGPFIRAKKRALFQAGWHWGTLRFP